MGIFKDLVVKRLRYMPSDRELYRRLWDNPMLREIRDIEDRERPHHSSQITRFLMNISPERLSGIIDGLVGELWREASSMGRRWRAGDIIVIASGGGSIPVIEDGEGHYEGVEAVIDKDLAGEVLAEVIKADIFLILTDVENVKLNFGKSDEKNIDEMTVEEAELFHEEGYFLPGGMGPKVKACIRFLNHGKAGHHHIISKGFRSLKRRKWN